MTNAQIAMDAILEIQDHTKHICLVWRREIESGNQSPWLDIAMNEGARLTTRAADIMQRVVNAPESCSKYNATSAIETRNNIAKIRRMLDEMFCGANDKTEFTG